MKKIFAFLFCVLIFGQTAVSDDSFPAANVGYVKVAMVRRGCIFTNTAPANQGANMEYLLKTVDICNNNLTNYGATARATHHWANTNAVDWCAENLVMERTYSQDGLIVHLDAVNNTGSGHSGSITVWKDISGHGNDFTLFNSPAINAVDISFNGVNQYARSTNMLNLSGFNAVTIEFSFKILSSAAQIFLFEHSPNWNTNTGGFGIVLNSDGHNTNPDMCHTVHNTTSAAAGANNYAVPLGDMTYHKMTNTFSAVANPTGRLFYNDGMVVSPSGLYTTGTAIYKTFRNDYMYLASRGGTQTFANIAIQSVRIYNRQLSATEICNNAWIDYARFGGTQPNCQ
jgi:hypothetical protein